MRSGPCTFSFGTLCCHGWYWANISLNFSNSNVLRFLWRDNNTDPIEDYQINVFLFDKVYSLCIGNWSIKKSWNKPVRFLWSNFYQNSRDRLLNRRFIFSVWRNIRCSKSMYWFLPLIQRATRIMKTRATAEYINTNLRKHLKRSKEIKLLAMMI